MVISEAALEYLLGKIKERTLGALFIETIVNRSFRKQPEKIEFLYRISDNSYLENYTSAWWNLSSRSVTEWQTRFEKSQFELGKRGILFEEGYYYAIAENDEDEHDSAAR